jgi:hypothetical protein
MQCTDKEVLEHLILWDGFRDFLKKEFEELEIIELYNSIKETASIPTELDCRFIDHFYNNFFDSGTEVYTVAWDSEGFGPGGNGFLKVVEYCGLTYTFSSDYDSELEFDKGEYSLDGVEDEDQGYVDSFGAIWSLQNDFVSVESDRFSDEELIEMALSKGLKDSSILEINGEVVDWKSFEEKSLKDSDNE